MIKEINMEDIPTDCRRKGERIKDIKTFIESGASAAEIFSDSTKNSSSLLSSCLVTIRRHGFPVSAIRRGERVFLIKKSPDGLDAS